MKILYAIQGTGNGHISRAKSIIPHLKEHGDLDILVSGIQSDISLPFDVKYQFHGMSFIFGKKGGVDFLNTYKKTDLKKFWKEVKSLPVEKYDLVINDFEPVSAWACYKKKLPCIGLSNQLAVLSPDAPQPKHEDLMGKFILKNYAPVTARYGMHFKSYNDQIYTPVIRKEVREVKIKNKEHYTVYLPAYDDERIVEVLSQFKDVKWEVFSKHNKIPIKEKNLSVQAINNEAFLKSMASSKGVLCAAGFATPSEVLYLNKKLMVIPMKKQFEQYCNAAALEEMGVPVLRSLKTKHADKIKEWLNSDHKVHVNYPEVANKIVDRIIQEHSLNKDRYVNYLMKDQFNTFGPQLAS